MKIKLSKSQWEEMGKQAGWMKIAKSSQVPLSNPQSDQRFQQALQLWKVNKQDEAMKLLQQIDPAITKDQVQQLLQQKQASSKGVQKEAGAKSWLANMFAVALLSGAMASGAFGNTNGVPMSAEQQYEADAMKSEQQIEQNQQLLNKVDKSISGAQTTQKVKAPSIEEVQNAPTSQQSKVESPQAKQQRELVEKMQKAIQDSKATLDASKEFSQYIK